MADDVLLTLNEAAKILRLKTSTLRAWRLAGSHLTFRKIGSKVMVLRTDIERFITESAIAPAK